jgi:hypothetical protein
MWRKTIHTSILCFFTCTWFMFLSNKNLVGKKNVISTFGNNFMQSRPVIIMNFGRYTNSQFESPIVHRFWWKFFAFWYILTCLLLFSASCCFSWAVSTKTMTINCEQLAAGVERALASTLLHWNRWCEISPKSAEYFNENYLQKFAETQFLQISAGHFLCGI